MSPNLVFTLGDFNRTNVKFTGAACSSTIRQNDIIMAKAGPGYTISNLECGTVIRKDRREDGSQRNRRYYSQAQLEKQFLKKLREEEWDPDITYHPSDHAPVHMEFTLSHGAKNVHMGILTWNVMTQGIAFRVKANGAVRGWPVRSSRLDQIDKMLSFLGELLLGAHRNGVPIVCLQEFGGDLWDTHLTPKALSAWFGFKSQPMRFAHGPSSLDSGDLATLAANPHQWLMFSSKIGKTTLIKASVIDQTRAGSRANLISRSRQLQAGLPVISTSLEISLLKDGLPILVRITNVHDTAILANYPGFDNDAVETSFQRGGRKTRKKTKN